MERQSNGRGRLGVLALVAAVAVVVLACGSTSTSSGSGTTSSGGTPGHTTAAGPAKVGDTITVDNVAVTLVSAAPLQGDDTSQPKAGDTFVLATVKIVNKGSSEASYNEFDFHAKSGAGNITDATLFAPGTYTGNNLLQSGQLAAGGTVTGDLILEVPQGDHKAELTWSPGLSNSTDNAWLLGL